MHVWDLITLLNARGTPHFHDTVGKSPGSFEHGYKEETPMPGGFATSNFLLSLLQAGSCYEQLSH